MNVTINDQYLKDIANAIREKNGTDETYKPREMGLAIEALPTGNNGEAYIQGTLEGEYYNSRITHLAAGAFDGPGAYSDEKEFDIVSITLPNVTTVGTASGHNWTLGTNQSKLEKLDLPSATIIYGPVFQYCENLRTVILRSGIVCDLSHIPFAHGPIYNPYVDNSVVPVDQGYIYVPDALREEYETEYGEAYTFRSIEEWPDVCYNPDYA